jgi:hypothetical protein
LHISDDDSEYILKKVLEKKLDITKRVVIQISMNTGLEKDS